MDREIKFAKYLTKENIMQFLESSDCIRINKNKPFYTKFGKHEIIVVGGALIEKHKTLDVKPDYKELSFLCILNDFQCDLTMAGSISMPNSRKITFKRKYAKFLLSQLPENLKSKYVQAYNANVKNNQEVNSTQE